MRSSSPILPRLLLPLLLVAFAASCEKPDLDECRRACWNYNEVMFWAKVDREVKAMSAEKAAAYRAAKEQEFQAIAKREEDQGLMNCIYDCQHNSNEKQIQCMKEATSETQLEGCMN
jgi:D-mannonate dehydratase